MPDLPAMTTTRQSILLGNRALTPSKIICIGRNYVEHIHELNNEIPDDMVVFLKPSSAISDELHSSQQEPLHYEGELCLLIQNKQIDAVGFGLDITKRKLQSYLKSKGLPWERAKAFDGSALFSPFINTPKVDSSFTLELDINGQNVQSGRVSHMIYQPAKIMQELQTFMTLNDGDIIMTGTPAGVGLIRAGDSFHGKIIHQGEIITQASWKAR